MLKLKLWILLSILSPFKCSIILQPLDNKPNSNDTIFILTQGANIPSNYYEKFGRTLQDNYNGRLWIAILTGFPLDLPESFLIHHEIENALNDLIKNGCKINKQTPFFFAGHSLGGVIIQDLVLNNLKFKENFIGKFAGLVLEGSYILRKNRPISQSISQPILTLGGELDGLCRITRMAESYYFNSQSNKDITLIIQGMNHYQFVGFGNEPSFVSKHDLKAEISNDEAMQQVTQVISAFMFKTLGIPSDISYNYLENQTKETATIIDPLVNALSLEGFYYFKPPCDDKLNESVCQHGSPWAERSQKLMTFDNITTIVTDTFRSVFQIPAHLPKIHNNCSSPYECSLNITTFTQNVYSIDDSFDNSLYHVAATEIRSKLVSNQSIILAATGIKYDFKETDGNSVCQSLNDYTIRYALRLAPKHTLDRYIKKGRKLVSGIDKIEHEGITWILNELEFKDIIDTTTNEPITLLHSSTIKFPVDYAIKLTAGLHYCKLLSPARALEWIYVDSLKI